MSETLSARGTAHIFERLRSGLVPERGLDTFAVGIERQRAELNRQLDLATNQEGLVKFLRGGYGCGKTFMSRVAIMDAQNRGFATSFVVVSDNDLHFHRFDDVYRKVVSELSTGTCPRGALGDILDRWIGNVEEALIASGADEDADDFDEVVRHRLAEELNSMTRGSVPDDFVRVVQTIFELKEQGKLAEAGSLLSWLSGSRNVAASAKRLAGIKGDISSRSALDYLHGILQVVKAAGYTGLIIVIDEAETILRMRRDIRGKSLNGIRQICDVASAYPGLIWMFTGTAEFFDTRRGVAGLPPLHDRILFIEDGGFASLRQPQLRLQPFDSDRLQAVARNLRAIFPSEQPERLREKISDAFIERLVTSVTAGFHGDVGIVPRQFLREFVNRMDLVEEHPEYDPMKAAGFEPTHLRSEERLAAVGETTPPVEANEDLIPVEDAW